MEKKAKNNNKSPKGLFFWVASALIIFVLYNMLSQASMVNTKDLNFTEFIKYAETGKIMDAKISANTVTGKMKEDINGPLTKYESTIPINYPQLYTKLTENNVNVKIEKMNKNDWITIILSWAPFLIILFFLFSFMKQQTGGKAFNFGKSKAKMFSGEKNKHTFKDVAGVEEAKEELQEIIEFLSSPQKFKKLGGKIPKGVLLVGPPGTGKTLLAKAVAGEANVPFFSISGSDFVEMFVGVGASRVRDLFEEGKKHSPCLVFIDEIDAVGRQRGAGLGGGHDEREQTLNQLLVEMDGFGPNEGVIVIAATNRPDILDKALLRPGRFDRRIYVTPPDVKGREAILKVHTENTPIADDVKLDVVARSTPGFTGADIANLVNEAALWASRQGKKEVDMIDFEYAKDKVLMGAERRSLIISDKEKKITAYHEAGHALLAALEEEADPLHKVSIIPRGRALGVTQQLPLNDKYTYSKKSLESQISVLLGGRLAEEIFLGEVTTGAQNDIERATSIARKMVCEWGMSDLGPLNYGKDDDMIFLGKDMMSKNDFSDETAREIDKEIKKIIVKIEEKAKKTLKDNADSLEKITSLLLEKESLNSDEIEEILQIKDSPKINREA